MKKYAMPLALASVITLQACNQEAPAPQTTVAEEPAALSLDTTEQRLSYGIAYGLGACRTGCHHGIVVGLALKGEADMMGRHVAQLGHGYERIHPPKPFGLIGLPAFEGFFE